MKNTTQLLSYLPNDYHKPNHDAHQRSIHTNQHQSNINPHQQLSIVQSLLVPGSNHPWDPWSIPGIPVSKSPPRGGTSWASHCRCSAAPHISPQPMASQGSQGPASTGAPQHGAEAQSFRGWGHGVITGFWLMLFTSEKCQAKSSGCHHLWQFFRPSKYSEATQTFSSRAGYWWLTVRALVISMTQMASEVNLLAYTKVCKKPYPTLPVIIG